jgi:hypothetical protein
MLLGLQLLPAPAGRPQPGAPSPTSRRELYFEFKLLFRGAGLGRSAGVDQWAGGRLLMELRRAAGADDEPSWSLELIGPLEDPWTFRWYPGRDEAKLGAAVSVVEPQGDPYHSLARLLEPQVRERYRLWWRDDSVGATAPHAPSWRARTDSFWSDQHRSEEQEKDPLPADAVYPFYVLGDPRGRFGARVEANGRLVGDSIHDRMSRPWLPQGWHESLSGRPVEGYGYWERKRPRWEPATYQALAAALRLLAWPCLNERTDQGIYELLVEPAEDRSPEVSGADLPERLADVITVLQPRAAGRLDWHGGTPMRFRVLSSSAEQVVVVGESDTLSFVGKPDLRYRVWRYFRHDPVAARPEHDELQMLVERISGPATKAWIKIGYRLHL